MVAKIGVDTAEKKLSKVCRSKQAIPTLGHKSGSANFCSNQASCALEGKLRTIKDFHSFFGGLLGNAALAESFGSGAKPSESLRTIRLRPPEPKNCLNFGNDSPSYKLPTTRDGKLL